MQHLVRLFRLFAIAAGVLWMASAVSSGVPPYGWVARADADASRMDGHLEAVIRRVLHPPRGYPSDVPAMASGPGGHPMGWTCGAPILWAVDTTGLPVGAVATVSQAVARISTVSGLRFRFAGATLAAPRPDWGSRPAGSEVLFGWVSRAASTMFAPPAPPDAVAMTDVVTSNGHIVGASVAFDAAEWETLTPGFGAGETRGELALHELEHVVGIGDQRRWPGDLSYEQLIPRPAASFGAGDLAGLRELGCPVRPIG